MTVKLHEISRLPSFSAFFWMILTIIFNKLPVLELWTYHDISYCLVGQYQKVQRVAKGRVFRAHGIPARRLVWGNLSCAGAVIQTEAATTTNQKLFTEQLDYDSARRKLLVSTQQIRIIRGDLWG